MQKSLGVLHPASCLHRVSERQLSSPRLACPPRCFQQISRTVIDKVANAGELNVAMRILRQDFWVGCIVTLLREDRGKPVSPRFSSSRQGYEVCRQS